MTAGAFEIDNPGDLRHYNIRPIDTDVEVPADQAALQAQIYATRGVLKLLDEQGLLKTEKERALPQRLKDMGRKLAGVMRKPADWILKMWKERHLPDAEKAKRAAAENEQPGLDEEREKGRIDAKEEQRLLDVKKEQQRFDSKKEQGRIDAKKEQGDPAWKKEQQDHDAKKEQERFELKKEQGKLDAGNEKRLLDEKHKQRLLDARKGLPHARQGLCDAQAGRSAFDEFSERARQIAEVGLVGEHAQTALAAAAIAQLRGEVLSRRGRHVIHRYLERLAGFAALGALIGLLVEATHGAEAGHCVEVADCIDALGFWGGYGFIIAGAMVGAWLSAAANPRDVTFDELPNFMSTWHEPIIRIAFVAALAVVAGLFVEKNLMTISIGNTEFNGFADSARIAVLLGVIAGIGERALSVRVLQRAGEFVTK